MRSYMFLLVCLQLLSVHAEQFVYPVADFDHGNQLVVLHQKSLNDIELWFVDAKTGYATKGLSSFLTPVNVCMMPSGRGFSFIDQGYIKIKEFEKRSARTIGMYEPIGLFSNMHWIDEDNFYFTARKGDFFQIFQSDIEANVQQITDEKADALYPQKIDSMVFYLRRDVYNNVALVVKNWNNVIQNNNKPTTVIIPQLEKQACFLHMISATEGFYIQAPIKKNAENDNCYEFICHHIQKTDDAWTYEPIFKFHIPTQYLVGTSRLHESIERFLPNFSDKNTVYFVSWQSVKENFELQKYRIDHKKIESISLATMKNVHHEKIFAPLICRNQIYTGVIFGEQEKSRLVQCENLRFQLPCYSK